MGHVQHYLETMAEFRQSYANKTGLPEALTHSSNESYVLGHGTVFQTDGKNLLGSYPRLKMKECYKNALELALQHSELFYCEGFAESVFPLEHAWCVTADGRIIDPTWGRAKSIGPKEYMGVVFNAQFILKKTIKASRYTGAFGFCRDTAMIPISRDFDKDFAFKDVPKQFLK